MKRMFSVVVIISMIGGTSLWAVIRGPVKGRTYNRDLQKRSGNSDWARCVGIDSDGPVSAGASIEVDVDKPWENLLKKPHKPQRWGVDYSASSAVSGTGYGGTYSLYADVPGGKPDGDSKSGDTNGETYDSVSDGDFDWWESVDAEEELSNCTAWGKISGASYESTPVLHKVDAQAWKFSNKGES